MTWPGPERFAAVDPQADELVFKDLTTGLEWQHPTHDRPVIWGDVSEEIGDVPGEVDALEYCESLVYGGRADWQLPNLTQLESLLAYDKDTGPISHFPGIQGTRYWTSTTNKRDPKLAWYVNFAKTQITTFGEYKNDKAVPKDAIFSHTTHLDVICMRDARWDE